MLIPFSKYSGCGNDFIVIDNRTGIFPKSDPLLIQRLCARRTGIGADGVILLENSTETDYRMRIFNADGGEAEMCGNGIRCLTKFLQEIGILAPHFLFETGGGKVRTVLSGSTVSAEMPAVSEIKWNLKLTIKNKELNIHSLNTGVPHAVIFVDNLKCNSLMEVAPEIRHHPHFGKAGTNVNFAQLIGRNVHLRTYERGVEDETLACGTGATAVAIATAKQYGIPSPISVIPASGDAMEIAFNSSYEKIILSGPAHQIYKGELVL